MTEAEWLKATESMPMLRILKGQASDRKLRMFAVGCARAVLQLLDGELQTFSGHCLDKCEEFADDRISSDTINDLLSRFMDIPGADQSFAAAAAWSTLQNAGCNRWDYMMLPVGHASHFAVLAKGDLNRQSTVHCSYLRDIFGNPFRPVAVDPNWRTSTVVALARGMYDGRDYSTMPLLADAFQDAGCESEDILNHCRGDGPHVRGCWVVDLILGKE